MDRFKHQLIYIIAAFVKLCELLLYLTGWTTSQGRLMKNGANHNGGVGLNKARAASGFFSN
jgi:hypothetical protein